VTRLRLIGLLSAILLLAAAPAPAAAYFNSPGYEWRASSDTVYDLSCDSPHSWEVTLYDSLPRVNGEWRLKLCSPENNLCDVMLADVAIPMGCSGDNDGLTWNDRISSFTVTKCSDCELAGGDYCIVLYDRKDYDRTGGQGHFNIWGKGSSGSVMVNTGWNDKVSSVGRSTLC